MGGAVVLAVCAVLAPVVASIPPPEEVDACRLLTEAEVTAYRGYEVTQAETRWARQEDDFDIATCQFEITDPAYDLYNDDYTGPMITLTVTDPIPTDDMYVDEWEDLAPLQSFPAEAYAVVTEDREPRGPWVSTVFAQLEGTHTVSLSPSLLGIPDDPGAVELLELAVNRLLGLRGAADPTTTTAATAVASTPADQTENETTGGLGDPVRAPTEETSAGQVDSVDRPGWLLGAGAVLAAGLAGLFGTRAIRRRRWSNALAGSRGLPPAFLATVGERASQRAAGTAETLTRLAAMPGVDKTQFDLVRHDAEEITGALGEMRRAYGQEQGDGYEIELRPHHLDLVESIIQSLGVRPNQLGSGSPLSDTPPFDPQRIIIRFDPATGSFSITEYSQPPSAGQIQAFPS